MLTNARQQARGLLATAAAQQQQQQRSGSGPFRAMPSGGLSVRCVPVFLRPATYPPDGLLMNLGCSGIT